MLLARPPAPLAVKAIGAPNAQLANLGVGGATSADVLAKQLDRAIALQPALVTLSIGPNDITRGVPVGRYESNLDVVLGTGCSARRPRSWSSTSCRTSR